MQIVSKRKSKTFKTLQAMVLITQLISLCANSLLIYKRLSK